MFDNQNIVKMLNAQGLIFVCILFKGCLVIKSLLDWCSVGHQGRVQLRCTSTFVSGIRSSGWLRPQSTSLYWTSFKISAQLLSGCHRWCQCLLRPCCWRYMQRMHWHGSERWRPGSHPYTAPSWRWPPPRRWEDTTKLYAFIAVFLLMTYTTVQKF